MKFLTLNENLYAYVQGHTRLAHPILDALAQETQKLEVSSMQISRDQGAFMALLAKLIGAKRCLEIGCFTGYSAIAVASTLPKDGKLYTLDISEEYTRIARAFFKKAELEDQIELMIGPALESLKKLKQTHGLHAFDFAFIDADKVNISAYYEFCLELVRPGGLILVDNVLWGGAVIDTNDTSEDTQAIRTFNRSILKDTRVEGLLATISDGIMVLRKTG